MIRAVLMTDETADERLQRLSHDRVDRPLPKRFYKLAGVTADLGIALDGRVIKTPLKSPFQLPTQSLAQAVAEEWNAQEKFINMGAMPLTKLANTAIDRSGPERAFVTGQVLEFAGTDLVCYRASEPTSLLELHDRHWTPIVAWARDALGAEMVVTTGIRHVAQSNEALTAVSRHLDTLNAFELTAAHNLTTLTGSALIALMLVAQAISPDEAWVAAHVDEDFQIAQWGEDFEAAKRRGFRRLDFDGSLRFLKLIA